jgi:hypothetical protein
MITLNYFGLGSHLEVVYNLQMFGIMAHAMPFIPNGDAVVTNLNSQKLKSDVNGKNLVPK